MKKILYSFVLVCLIAITAVAQDYNTGIGIRTGTSNGLTVKHFIATNRVLEAIVATRWEGYNFTALYQVYRPAWNVNRLNWFYGVGGHVGSYRGEGHRHYDNNEQYWLLGIDGIIGMEYNFQEIPFNISLDWKPAFDVTGGFYPWGDEVAFSLRYIF